MKPFFLPTRPIVPASYSAASRVFNDIRHLYDENWVSSLSARALAGHAFQRHTHFFIKNTPSNRTMDPFSLPKHGRIQQITILSKLYPSNNAIGGLKSRPIAGMSSLWDTFYKCRPHNLPINLRHGQLVTYTGLFHPLWNGNPLQYTSIDIFTRL